MELPGAFLGLQSHIHRDLLTPSLILCLLRGTRLAQLQDEAQDVFFKY